MKMKIFLILFLTSCFSIYSQVKIGNNPSAIHPYSILELESTDKVLVISRMTTTQMNAISPLNGALVYNTDENCVFMYTGSSWNNLCNSNVKVTTSLNAPINNNVGDFWINDSLNNLTSIWDGSNWVSIDNNPRKGNGTPNNTNAPNPIAGDIYVDTNTGAIYAYNGTSWVNSNAGITANNGLLISSTNTIQLGGVLIKPTTITTDITNTLAIAGLQTGNTNTDDIVTIDKTSGELKKITASNLFREEVTEITANDNQLQFTPLITITDSKKVNVYRNGVRVDFTVINSNTIQLEANAKCYQGDQIRIIQFY